MQVHPWRPPQPPQNEGRNVGRPSKRSKKRRGPVIFCRPGVPQPEKGRLTEEMELGIKFGTLNLNTNLRERFEDMGLHPQILEGIRGYGLTTPGFIQKRAIVPIVQGKDAIVQAQSGMGKTAALVISVLQRLDRNDPNCQALILAPTRELAEQIQKVFIELSKFMVAPNVTNFACIGGRDDFKQCKEMCSMSQVVIGTVGRTAHMLVGDGDGSFLGASSLKVLALDEADQMLDGSYGKDLTRILEKIPPPTQTQVIIMSATMPGNILKLAYRFMVNPQLFLVRDYQLTLAGIQQYYVGLKDDAQKFETLRDLLPILQQSRGMIFCNTRKLVETLVRKLDDAGHFVAAIIGTMSQIQRDKIMKKFRQGEPGHRIIITSDLLGRGIDIQDVNLVVNYDLPDANETYIHRIGRAGRYGRKGVAISFVEENRKPVLEGLKEFYQTEIEQMPQEGKLQKILDESRAK